MKKKIIIPEWVEEGISIWVEIRDTLDLEPIKFLPADIDKIDTENGLINVIYVDSNGDNPVRGDRVCKRTGDYKLIKNIGDLVELNDAELLKSLEVNYLQEEIFTFCGETLISINPYELLQKHESKELKDKYISYCKEVDSLTTLDPHFWSISVNAYKNMITKMEKQAILISGESGAGKTEGTKRVLNLLISVHKSFGRESINKIPIEQRIYNVNPILEAFGNSKTIRNDNSSRFGKYISIYFDKDTFSIKGAKINNYLLEKSRVCRILDGERNFHIFYSFLKLSSQEDLEKFKIVDKGEKYNYKNYNIINKSNVFDCPTINEEEFYFDVIKSFISTGFSNNEIDSIWKIIGIIYNLGNFEIDKSQFKEGETPCRIIKNKYFYNVVELLCVKEEELENSWTQKIMKIENSLNFIPLNPNYCESIKISFIQALYNNLFDWIVKKFNLNLLPRNFDNLITIGILDIFGFEIFNVNSLEQFCINFTNEKLQSLYVTCTFKYECEIFKNEGLNDYLHLIKFKDNEDLLNSLDYPKIPPGVFNLIDNTCKLNKDYKYLIKDIIQNHQNSIYIKKPKFKDNIFTVKHTARDVDYTVDEFVEKNKDEIPNTINNLMDNSDNTLRNIFFGCLDDIEYSKYKDNEDNNKKSHLEKFLGYNFRKNMNLLDKELKECNSHFIRCLKPNEQKKPKYFLNTLVLMQIRYMGIWDSIKVRKNSYPYRLTFKDFFIKYKDLDKCQYSSKTIDELNSLKLNYKDCTNEFINNLNLKNKDELVLFGNTKLFCQESFIIYIDKELKIILKEKIKSINIIKNCYYDKKMKNKIIKLKNDSYNTLENTKDIFSCWNSKLEYTKFKKFLIFIKKVQKRFLILKEKRILELKQHNINLLEKIFITYKIKNTFKHQLSLNNTLYKVISKLKSKLFFRRIRFTKEIIYQEIFNNAWKVIENKLLNNNMMKITKIWRAYNCKIVNKKLIDILKEKLKLTKINYSATQIQKRVKGYLLREKFIRIHDSTMKIQGFVRMIWLKIYLSRLKSSVRVIQRFYKKYYIKKIKINSQQKLFLENNLNYFSNISNLEYKLLFNDSEELFDFKNFENYEKFNFIKEDKKFYKRKAINQIPDYSPNIDPKKAKLFSVLVDFQVNLDTTDIYPQTWANDFNYFCQSVKKNKSNFLHLELGDTFTFGITNELKIYSWGLNIDNQLARKTDTNSDYNLPKLVKNLTYNNIKLMSLGKEHGVSVDYSNNIYTWGNNYNYQLGLNNNNNRESMNILKKRFNSSIKKIKCLENDNYLLDSDGNLYKWPDYNNHLTIIYSPKILEIKNEKIKIINMSFGDDFSFFITDKKLIYCLGNNKFGQLGIEGVENSDKLILLDYFYNNKEFIIDIKCGYKHVLALNNLNKLFVWGLNNKGQIGYTKDKIQYIPQIWNLKENLKYRSIIKSVSAGQFSSYLLLDDKSLIKLGDKFSDDPITKIKYTEVNNYLNDKDNFFPVKIFSKYNNYMSLCYIMFLDTRNLKEKKFVKEKIANYLNEKYTQNDSQILLNQDEYLQKYIDTKYWRKTINVKISTKQTTVKDKSVENKTQYNIMKNHIKIEPQSKILIEKNKNINQIKLDNPMIFSKKESKYSFK